MRNCGQACSLESAQKFVHSSHSAFKMQLRRLDVGRSLVEPVLTMLKTLGSTPDTIFSKESS